jgi:DNA repair protein RecO (recombination protein O)
MADTAGFDTDTVPQERTEAIVLRGVDFSESSRIVTFLTPNRGRMACMAQGVRRAKSQLAPVLDTFNRVELIYYYKEGRSVQKLGEATLLDGYQAIKSNLDKAVFTAFPLELAYKAVQEDDPAEDVYDALMRGFESMAAWTGDVKAHAVWQVIQLLCLAGFEPDLDNGDRGGDSVRWSHAHGVAEPGSAGDRRISRVALDGLRLLVRSRDACPRIEDAGEAFDALRGYVTRQLESDFRSLRVIEQMYP